MTAILATVLTVADLAAAIPRMVSTPTWIPHQFRGAHGEARALALARIFHAEATRADLDPLLLAAVAANESGFHASAVGRGGERGLLQIHMAHAQRFGCSGDLWDVRANIRCGAKILRYWRDRQGGGSATWLAAYTCGGSRSCRRGRGLRYARRVLARIVRP